ncbi:MFS transporter [Pseudonocardia lacus]|uniref:MFS transporter n=1 Tax=Pseudonocardia lacus TaxID=2835865 RepID=UPI0027E355D7|nr:MFS transporter [Pseudonocardia lacus]
MHLRTSLLAAGAFAVGTSAYVISGVLPAVSAELGVSLTAAGQLVTAFALAVAVGAPVLATLAGRWDRRTLLLVALLTAAAGNAIAALATTYPALIAGRVVTALGAAAYTPAATLFATALRPPEERARAVAVVFSGLTIALALGVPIGTLLGDTVGYRWAFALVAVVSLVVAAVLVRVLPRMAPPPAVSLRERFAVAADRRVLTMIAVTVLGVLATMSVYIYIVPLLAATAGLSGAVVGALLLVYGVGAIVGNAVGGRAADRFGPLPALFGVLAGFVVMIATLPLTATTVAGAAVALFIWSAFTWSFNPPVQSMLLDLAPSGLVLALNASAIYFGMALAGVLGGVVVDTVGVLALPVFGSALAVAVVGLLLTVRTRPAAPVAQPVGATAD